MNQIFLKQSIEKIKNWFMKDFPSWPTYTTLKFVDGTTQTKEISGAATWQNIGVKNDMYGIDTTLTYCQLGKNVTEISGYAFLDCHFLTSISILNSVTSIFNNAFSRCSSLTSITIPNSITEIGYYAFSYCTSLSSIIFKGKATSAEIATMSRYPWGITDTSIIKPGK